MNGTTASTVQFGTTTSDATFKATFTLDSYSGTVSGSASTLSYTIPASWCAALLDATSGDAKVTGQILFGGVVYRTLTSTLRFSVPTSVVPSVTAMTFSDSGDSAVPSSWGIFVQNQSELQLKTLTCAGAYGSSIKKVRMTADSKIQTAEYPSLPEIAKITQSGDVSVLITVTDSRGRTGSMTSKVNFQPYAAPKLSSVKSERCDAEGNVDNDGMYFLSTTAAVFSSCSGKNAVTLTVQYKRTDLKTYGDEKIITPSSNVCAANDLDPEYSYDVLYTLSDAFNTVTYSDYVSTAVYLMHFLHGGRGVACGDGRRKYILYFICEMAIAPIPGSRFFYTLNFKKETEEFWNTIQLIFAGVGGWLGYFLGGCDGLLYALLAFVVIDYLTGVMCTIADRNLSSAVGFKGICRKVLIFLLVGIANILDVQVIGTGSVLRTAVIFFYISNEGVSLLENAAHLGLPVPQQIKGMLEQLHDRAESEE